MKESVLQSKITRYLKCQGRFYVKTQAGAGTQVGSPDIVTLNNEGKFVGLELKRDDNVGSYGVTLEQRHQGNKIKSFNGEWHAIKSFTEFLELEGFEDKENFK